jgi:hypothetical protein|uniref:Uncharacterized protein n=1 Tax=Siphoviridae sp. ctksc2 TaxID=2825645 RepID=A0A8S5US09_9CAUD|nr:MAG TPA: hypothetical protein [Siphoviridae sp. ctksc2]
MLKPLGGGEYSFRWQMLSAVPVIHQKCEAVADLMNLLRTLGMVLTSEPRTTVKHGVMPVLSLKFRARYATDHEARQLQQPPHPHHNDQEEAAA